MTSTHRLMRSLFSGAIVPVLAALPVEAAAQSGHPPETGWLSTAIEEVRRSPFHATESAVSLGSGVPRPLWSHSRTWSIQTASNNDSTFPNKRVFLVSLGAAALSDIVGVVFLLCSTYGDDDDCLGEGLNSAAVIAIPVLGTALGAKLAGARFGPALAGSAVGFFAALLSVALVDPNNSPVLYFAIPATIQATFTTLVAWGLN